MKYIVFIVRTVLAIVLLVILYHFALNGRYHYIEGSPYAVDKWTNTVSQPANWEKFTKELNKQEGEKAQKQALETNEVTDEEPIDEEYE